MDLQISSNKIPLDRLKTTDSTTFSPVFLLVFGSGLESVSSDAHVEAVIMTWGGASRYPWVNSKPPTDQNHNHPAVNQQGNGKSHFLVGNTSSNGPYSIAILFYWSVGASIIDDNHTWPLANLPLQNQKYSSFCGSSNKA